MRYLPEYFMDSFYSKFSSVHTYDVSAKVLYGVDVRVNIPVRSQVDTWSPSGVAAFMSAHSKTPYITPSMGFSSGKGVVRRGRRGQQPRRYLVPVCM